MSDDNVIIFDETEEVMVPIRMSQDLWNRVTIAANRGFLSTDEHILRAIASAVNWIDFRPAENRKGVIPPVPEANITTITCLACHQPIESCYCETGMMYRLLQKHFRYLTKSHPDERIMSLAKTLTAILMDFQNVEDLDAWLRWVRGEGTDTDDE